MFATYMILSSAAHSGPQLLVIEACLTALAATVAFGWPRLGNSLFSRIEHLFGRLARRKGWAVIAVGASVVVIRLGLLPLLPIPKPFIPDDFSFLLAADTFLHGRLSNPTPAMWVHFES